MAKPILRSIPAFDARLGYGVDNSVEIVYSGTAVYNKLYIYAADTNKLVVNGEQSSGIYLNIKANTLTNNKSYYCCVSIVDEYNNETDKSDFVFFSCYDTPSFFFDNIEPQINTSSLTAKLLYSQANGRELMSYIFYLYDYNQLSAPISSSATYYDSTMEYTYKGLESGKKYYIRAVGDTVDGMVVDTGLVQISVQYVMPNDEYYILDLENNSTCGWIQYKTNIHIIEGSYVKFLSTEDSKGIITQDRNNIVAKFDFQSSDVADSMVDCKSAILVYDKGWSVDDSFMLRVNFAELQASAEYPCIRLLDEDGVDVSIYLNAYYDNDRNFVRFKLVVDSEGLPYIAYSEPFYGVTNNITGSLMINRIDNLYSIVAFNIGGST